METSTTSRYEERILQNGEDVYSTDGPNIVTGRSKVGLLLSQNNGAYNMYEPGTVQSRHQPKAHKCDNQGLFLFIGRLDKGYNN